MARVGPQRHGRGTQYPKDQLQLAAMHIGKVTQGEESTAQITNVH